MSDIATAPPPTVETHDPIPESSWLWRRVFVFALCSMVCVGIWVMVITMVNLASNQPTLIVGAFVKIIGWLLLLVWFAMTYYIVGTSGEQVVKIVQTAGLFKSGLSQTVTKLAEGPDGSRAEATTVTGPLATDLTAAPQVVAAPPPEEAPWR